MIKINNLTQITSFIVQDCNNVNEFKSEKFFEIKHKSLLSELSTKKLLINSNKDSNLLSLMISKKYVDEDLKKKFLQNPIFILKRY